MAVCGHTSRASANVVGKLLKKYSYIFIDTYDATITMCGLVGDVWTQSQPDHACSQIIALNNGT